MRIKKLIMIDGIRYKFHKKLSPTFQGEKARYKYHHDEDFYLKSIHRKNIEYGTLVYKKLKKKVNLNKTNPITKLGIAAQAKL